MAITTSSPYEPFTPENYSAQTERNIALIESQFSETQQPQPQPKYPIAVQPYPIYFQTTTPTSGPDPLTIIAIVGLLGLFGLFAYLAYKR